MKITRLLPAALILCSLGLFSQEIPGKKVPYPVHQAFKSKFSEATEIKWEMENEKEYEANFIMKGSKQSASFDDKGTWLETEMEIPLNEVPAKINTVIAKKFIGYTTTEASKVDHFQFGSCYEIGLTKSKSSIDLLFSSDGKFIRKESDPANDAEEPH